MRRLSHLSNDASMSKLSKEPGRWHHRWAGLAAGLTENLRAVLFANRLILLGALIVGCVPDEFALVDSLTTRRPQVEFRSMPTPQKTPLRSRHTAPN
jgi:hypothetical protein